MDQTGFKLYLLRQGIDRGTIEKHISSLTNILSKVDGFTKTNLEQHLIALVEKGRSAGHLNNLVAAMRHYGRFIGVDCESIKYFPVTETTKGVLSDEEIRKIIAITPQEMESYLQSLNRSRGVGRYKVWIDHELFNLFTLFFTILAHTGLRPKELVKLRISQVDFGANVIRLDETTKTGEPRTIAMSGIIAPLLQKHIQGLATNRLFPDWDRHKWKHQFNMRKDYCGIKREKITVYSLRHSWITSLLDNEANLFVVSDMAGHRDLNTTRHYYKMTTKSKLQAIKKLSLTQDNLSKRERALMAKETLEKDGLTVVEFRELENGNFRLEVS